MLDSVILLFKKILCWLNGYAGLLSLCAVLAAIIVPNRIYRKQRKDELQSIKDELESIDEIGRFTMTSSQRELYTRKHYLEKRLRHK